ncbi:MAG TPA: VIT1/CCC1 transporter family protein [Anaerolineaceae bacterium]|nr:VIT1/CCC1 transporter family protein [Anaerolineaceae bacterium]
MSLTTAQKDRILVLQQEELDGHYTYLKLATAVKDEHNAQVLQRIAEEEMKHYQVWKRYTQRETKPKKWRVQFYYWLAKVLGLTFGVKLMELGEEKAQENYKELVDLIPEARQILAEEEQHENELLEMLDEESLKYAGSVVLGLNDALVELTGALAGLTFAFQNTQTIALAGLITGISAAFSMAASEYLSSKSEEGEKSPVKSAIYTGFAYILTVAILIFPYLVAKNFLVSLAWTIANAILVIAIFNFYISVAKGFDFKKRFFEMSLISLGVALFSFLIGNLVRRVFGIEV